MFNQGTFNQSQFNTGALGEVLYAVFDGLTTMQGTVGSEVALYGAAYSSGSFGGAFEGASGLIESAAYATELESVMLLTTWMMGDADSITHVQGQVALYTTFYPTVAASTSLMGRVAANSTLYGTAHSLETMMGNQAIDAILFSAPIDAGTVFQSQVTAVEFEIKNAYFAMTIPPGGVLIIDSGNYVVLLDGENAIHAYEGDWLTLTRDTYDVTFTSASGDPKLSKELLYVERWL